MTWQRAISQAERLVGYPTSFMSLRHLLSDEVAQVALQLRRLVGTEHPLLKTARGLLGDQKRGSQTRGLVVLLLSKAAGCGPGILAQQRSLAEVAETIHTASLIHRGILNSPHDSDLLFGNRLATLSGDFLLAAASTGLAELHNSRVVALVSAAIGDIIEAEFSTLAVKGDSMELTCVNLLDVSRELNEEDWEQYVGFARASLLSACARSAMIIGETEKAGGAASTFADRWARLHCLNEEMTLLKRGLSQEEIYGLCPRPFLAHIACQTGEGEFLTENCGAVRRCRERSRKLAEEAKASLIRDLFPEAECRSTLCRLVDCLSI